jgi:hypothetical protein
LDGKEYGLEVRWKRRYIERRSSLKEKNMDKKNWIKNWTKKLKKYGEVLYDP